MTGGAGANHDEKSTNATTTGLAKTFRTLRKRLSRTSATVKNENPFKNVSRLQVEKDHSGKEGDDETDGSSGAEEISQFHFSPEPATAEPDFAGIRTSVSPAVLNSHLKFNCSLPADHAPRIFTSPPPEDLNDSNEKNNDSTSSNENASLSKTWSSFTGAQLRGTCSLEYAECMKDKGRRRKTHMIDLRKDEPFSQPFQQKLTATSSLITSKLSISRSLTSSRSLRLTNSNPLGARCSLSLSLSRFHFLFFTDPDLTSDDQRMSPVNSFRSRFSHAPLLLD